MYQSGIGSWVLGDRELVQLQMDFLHTTTGGENKEWGMEND
jgi:hypothetical protein